MEKKQGRFRSSWRDWGFGGVLAPLGNWLGRQEPVPPGACAGITPLATTARVRPKKLFAGANLFHSSLDVQGQLRAQPVHICHFGVADSRGGNTNAFFCGFYALYNLTKFAFSAFLHLFVFSPTFFCVVFFFENVAPALC